jgi:glycogen phosphorylase
LPTNHTVLPEALETWRVDLMARLLPRHMEIIYEINHRFLEAARRDDPFEAELPGGLSLIQDGPERQVRMSHLAIVASHAVNGVAELHTSILKTDLFRGFHRIFPHRFQNVTNGITPRRWLYQANPALARLITSAIGPQWIGDLTRLQDVMPLADDFRFRAEWMEGKRENKKRLARYILRKITLPRKRRSAGCFESRTNGRAGPS